MSNRPLDAVDEHIINITREAHLEIMDNVLTIVRDREETPDQAFLDLDAQAVLDIYFGLVGPTIDLVEKFMKGELYG